MNIPRQTANGIQSKLKEKEKQKDLKKKPKNTDQEEEGDQDYGDENNDDQWFSDSSTSSTEGEEREPRLVMYAAFTQYEVVKEVGKSVQNYHLTKDDQKDWDIAWFDGAISLKLLQKMWPHQRTNHFPGMYNLARKNCLGRHLMRMQKWFPDEYNFFPQTFMLPTDYKEFKAQITAKRNKTFIVKPEASCQGKGIFLTRNFEDCDPAEHYVVQRYMHKPYLIDGFKFDLRIYVLLCGVNPLRIYVYKDGLARFATVPYESPAPANLPNLFMHLTNYAINKDSENFVQNTNENRDDVGSKRSFSSILRQIAESFGQQKSDDVFNEINNLIIKTLCIAQPYLQHLYKSCQPDDIENSMCCQVLGFDVILDHNLVPQLLEVNQSPSFTTDSPLDYKIKKALISDTIKLWNLSIKRKLRVKGNKRAEMQRRLLNYQQNGTKENVKDKKPVDEKKVEAVKGVTEKIDVKKDQDAEDKSEPQSTQKDKPQKGQRSIRSPKGDEKKQLLKQQLLDERDQQRKKKMLHREKVEKELCGDYVLVYPLVSYEEEFQIMEQLDQSKPITDQEAQPFISDQWSKQQEYLTFMEKAKQLWESFTQGNVINKKKREQEMKEKEELAKKEQQKKKILLLQKMKKDKEERKAKEDQRKLEVEQFIFQQKNQMMGSGTTESQQTSEDNRYTNERVYVNSNQNHISYRTSSTGVGPESSRNGVTYLQEIQSRSGMHQQNSFSNVNLHDMHGINSSNQNRSAKNQFDQESLGNQGFYLPQVDMIKGYQFNKKAVHEDYEKQTLRYNQLIKYYQQTEENSLPAVPALSNQSPFLQEQMKSRVNQSNRREIVLVENPQALQKPPLNNSQLFKRDELESTAKILNSKKSINPNNPQISLLPNQRLNELLQIPNYTINTNNNQIALRFHNQIQSNQNAAGGQKLLTEVQLNGINHYTIKPNNYEMIRSMSMDKRELPQISNNSKQQSNSVAVSQVTNRGEIKNKKRLSPTKKTKSEILAKADDDVQLGIVGERKQLITNDITGKMEKRAKVVKIKEKTWTMGANNLNYVNPHELYKLLN